METVVNKEQLQRAFAGKKIFITGHTGFKGTWLSLILNLLGAEIKGYALAPEGEQSIYSITQPLTGDRSVIADIRDKSRLTQEIDDFNPDYIFHLAAQPLVRRSYEIPAETFEVNAIGTANLLEALISIGKKCTTVVVTTDKVYENKEQDILYKEEDRLGGYDPYSASKACTEIVIDSFRNSFFNTANYQKHQKAIASVRAGNVIGGGDFSRDRIIPDIVQALQANRTIEVRNPYAVRPWQHVLEPLMGYLLLAMKLDEDIQYSGAYNFGPRPQDHLQVKDLVTHAVQSWGSGEWADISGNAQPHEATLLKLDIGKALQVLQWQPKLEAAEAISWTIDWYKSAAIDASSYTQKQIETYLAL